jgi:hypothetical protein
MSEKNKTFYKTWKTYTFGISLIIIAGIVTAGLLFFGFDEGENNLSAGLNLTPRGASQYFSIREPIGYTVYAPVRNQEEELLTIENRQGSGFQIYSIAFDEPGPVTAERILEDLPDADINEPSRATLDGTDTFVFYGFHQDLGETFEVWVIHRKRLYQITGPKEQEKFMVETLNTWKWSS